MQIIQQKKQKRNDQGGHVPPGFVLVDVILTADQVRVVQRWAKLAQVEIKAAAEAVPAKSLRQEKRRATAEGCTFFID